jgi:methylphosphotriester-DNA--protein-cysteine methyltransferase
MRIATVVFILLLLTAAAASAENAYKYVGNSFSLKFHRPSCPFAKKMWHRRMQLFHLRKDAIEAGYQPCKYCLPPYWLSVRGTIRLPTAEEQSP